MKPERWAALIVFLGLSALGLSAVFVDTTFAVSIFIICLFIPGCICVTISYFFFRRKKGRLQALLLALFADLGYNCLSQCWWLAVNTQEPYNVKYLAFRAFNIIPFAIICFFLALYLFTDKKE